MKKIATLIAMVALLGSIGISQVSAAGLSTGAAERAVVKKLKAKHGTIWAGSFDADCRKLNNRLAKCKYGFTKNPTVSGLKERCKGSAKVRKYKFGLTVKLGPAKVIIGSGRC